MQISQCLHTAIIVSDLEIAEDFYGRILGLAKVDRSLKYPGAWYQVGNYQIHLIVGSNERSPLQNAEKWGRNPHIALGAIDLEAAKQELVTGNYPMQTSASGRAAIFTQDPDGNIIELSQIQ
jgi:catechol 2,3-dioxygenase-like lactoylglutathione lyase family enzyme